MTAYVSLDGDPLPCHISSSSNSFASLGFLRFLVIDEADKLLDYHFNQWLPKLLKAVSHDKTTPKGCGSGRRSLAETLQGLCLHPGRFHLMSPHWGNAEKVTTSLRFLSQYEGF